SGGLYGAGIIVLSQVKNACITSERTMPAFGPYWPFHDESALNFDKSSGPSLRLDRTDQQRQSGVATTYCLHWADRLAGLSLGRTCTAHTCSYRQLVETLQWHIR